MAKLEFRNITIITHFRRINQVLFFIKPNKSELQQPRVEIGVELKQTEFNVCWWLKNKCFCCLHVISKFQETYEFITIERYTCSLTRKKIK